MFYQYLRGKQYELLALRATADVIGDSGNIVPIIEPVNRKFSGLETAANALFKAKSPLLVVTNPMVKDGDWETSDDVIMENDFPSKVRDDGLLIPSRIIAGGAAAADLKSFLNRYQGREVALIHQERCNDVSAALDAISVAGNSVRHLFLDGAISKSYSLSFKSAHRALLRDGFARQEKNALYPDDDFFSDLHSTYKSDGYQGFGDFSVVGDYFRIGGGGAHAVAVHVTYHRPGDDAIHCRHFVSDSNATASDPGLKFLEATRKAVRFFRNDPIGKVVSQTSANRELLDYYRQKHYPGLGKLKELGMRHHLELMAGLL